MLSRVRLSRRSGVIAEAGADFHSPKVAMRRADEARRPDHERRQALTRRRRHPPSPQPTPHHYTGTHTTRHRTAVLP